MLKNSTIEKRTIEIIKSITQITKDVTVETSLAGVHMNSISFIKVVIALEDEFNVEFDDDKLRMTAFMSVGDFVEYISIKIK